MQSNATTVAQYLDALPSDRRTAIAAVREVILANLGEGYEEGMQYGMIGYHVPHRVFPAGYHVDPRQPVPFAALASQKGYMSLYLMSLYGDEAHWAWFREAFARAGKKLDMGKVCVRFKKLDDLPLEVIGEVIRRVSVERFLTSYQARLAETSKGARASAAAAKAPKASTTKAAATKSAAKPRAKR